MTEEQESDDLEGAKETDDDGDQPEIDDEEMADFGAVAAEIEESSGPDDEDIQEGDVDDEDVEEELPDADDVGGPDVSVGTIYCNGLGMSAAVARARYGSAEDDDREKLVDEYASMAEELQIDEYVDQWLEEHGGVDQLSPGQAILVSTILWGSLVAMDDPEMLENALEEGSA